MTIRPLDCGQIDPGVLLYLMVEKGYDAGEIERLLYHCAVTHRLCRQALINNCVVLLRNARGLREKR
jgi:hypothetical protein